MAQINTRIILRNDDTLNWLLNQDVVLMQGEVGIEFIDDVTYKIKIGNGVTPWKDLPYFGGEHVVGDDKSIITDGNIATLKGFEDATVNAQVRKNAKGELEWFIPSTEAVDALTESVAELRTDVDDLKDDSTSLLSKVESLEYALTETGDGTVDAMIDEAINEFASKISDDGTVNTLKELIDYVAEHGGEVTEIVNDILAVEKELTNKVDKVDGMGLSTNDFSNSLLDKLNSIEDNAQVNVIEQISSAGTILDIVNKSVNIPLATLNVAGVVKSSTGENKVNIANNGTMSVNKINVNSLFIPIGEELILNGGHADGSKPQYPTRIGNVGYNSIAEAVNCADNGDIITLQEDVNMGYADNNHLVVNAENVTLDLGGKTLAANGSNGAIQVKGGVTTLSGTGKVEASLGSDGYSMAIWAKDGTVVINDGIYNNMTDGSARGTDLIYVSGTGCVEINGGIFEAAKPEWTLNVKDVDYKAGTAKIIVKGGSFKNFDPANNAAEGAGTNFVAEGYKSVLEGEYYVVKPI